MHHDFRRWACALSLAALIHSSARVGAGESRTSPSAVGFRVLERVDTARTSKAFPNGRPIQISLWYPSASASPPLVYRDYVALAATETSFGAPSPRTTADAISRFKSSLASAGVAADDIDALLENPMTAARNAEPAAGRFPLLLIAQGNDQSVPDQAFLAELLAGHGYVVATTPSQARIGGPMKTEEEIPVHASDQAADLAFAAGQLRSQPNVRAGKLGLIGYSFGARSALLFEMREPDVGALISLDGGIGGKTGTGMLDKARGFDRSRATAPLLHLYEEGDPRQIPDLALIRSLERADRWLVKVEGMRHIHFSSLGLAAKALPSLAAATGATERTAPAWNAVAAAAASFVDRFVAGRPPASGRGWTPPTNPLLRAQELPAASLPSPTPSPPAGEKTRAAARPRPAEIAGSASRSRRTEPLGVGEPPIVCGSLLLVCFCPCDGVGSTPGS